MPKENFSYISTARNADLDHLIRRKRDDTSLWEELSWVLYPIQDLEQYGSTWRFIRSTVKSEFECSGILRFRVSVHKYATNVLLLTKPTGNFIARLTSPGAAPPG